MKIWMCKIGEAESIPQRADGPMRLAATTAYGAVTGVGPRFIISGWGAKLTEPERADKIGYECDRWVYVYFDEPGREKWTRVTDSYEAARAKVEELCK